MTFLLYERPEGGLIMATPANVVRAETSLAQEVAAGTDWAIEKANPHLKWIAGNYVEGDVPNSNKQLWTSTDLAEAEHTIKFAPLNLVHKVKTPIGFIHSTRAIEVDAALEGAKRVQIMALSAMWSHVFPFEAALVEAADERGLLFYSMECRAEQLHCAGSEGCGETFDYMKPADHCEHLKERTSIRHMIKPTFRGSALIVPPVRPGWKSAHASVLAESALKAATEFARESEAMYDSLNGGGADLSTSEWESLMAMVLALDPA